MSGYYVVYQRTHRHQTAVMYPESVTIYSTQYDCICSELIQYIKEEITKETTKENGYESDVVILNIIKLQNQVY